MKIFEDTNRISYSGGQTDMFKFVLSLFIVAIHFTKIPLISPVLRCAVPLFFILSSFFFFRKYDNVVSVEEKKGVYEKYIKRNFLLYFFWFIVLFPYTIVFRGWFNDSFTSGLVAMLRSFLFSSTFPASWYIMASVIGTSLIVLLDRVLSNRIVLIISLLAYAFCVITSNYGNIIAESSTLSSLYELYRNIFTQPYNSFPASLLWIYIGRCLSRKDETSLSIFSLLVTIFLSFSLLYGEYFLIQYYNFAVTDDCYFMLVPTCVSIAILLGKVKSVSSRPFLRKTSTIIYCSHLVVGSLISFSFNIFVLGVGEFVEFLIILIACISLSWVILSLEKKFAFLRYAY